MTLEEQLVVFKEDARQSQIAFAQANKNLETARVRMYSAIGAMEAAVQIHMEIQKNKGISESGNGVLLAESIEEK